MKLSGTAALYAQLKELQGAVAVTQKQIALAEELDEPKPEKKTRGKRKPKANSNGADSEAKPAWAARTVDTHLQQQTNAQN